MAEIVPYERKPFFIDMGKGLDEETKEEMLKLLKSSAFWKKVGKGIRKEKKLDKDADKCL